MTFRFEALLHLRKNTEQQEQREMARRQQHLSARRSELEDLKASGAHHRAGLQSRLAQAIDGRTLALYSPYLESLSTRSGSYETIITESEKQVESKRQELIEAMTKRRALEILKERELLKKKQQAHKEEIAFADEMAATRWQRKGA